MNTSKIYFIPMLMLALMLTVMMNLAIAACPTTAAKHIALPTSVGEVKDTHTGLVWARCSVGQTWSNNTCTGTALKMSHQDAITHASSQTGWRLPNVKELSSLTDTGCFDAALDTATFPNTPSTRYWTSTPQVSASNKAWTVDFKNAGSITQTRVTLNHVRLLRTAP